MFRGHIGPSSLLRLGTRGSRPPSQSGGQRAGSLRVKSCLTVSRQFTYRSCCACVAPHSHSPSDHITGLCTCVAAFGTVPKLAQTGLLGSFAFALGFQHCERKSHSTCTSGSPSRFCCFFGLPDPLVLRPFAADPDPITVIKIAKKELRKIGKNHCVTSYVPCTSEATT